MGIDVFFLNNLEGDIKHIMGVKIRQNQVSATLFSLTLVGGKYLRWDVTPSPICRNFAGGCMFMHVGLSSNPTSYGTVFSRPCIFFVAQIALFIIANLIHEIIMFNYTLVY